MANQEPNLYELSGHGIHVIYSATSISGQPLFNYHDTFQAKSFSGQEITIDKSILGTSVSVFLLRTIDGPSTSFTLLVPNVRLATSGVAMISTQGITTLHKNTFMGPPMGQDEFYTVHPLHGTARFVVS
jgi:hypothetical protein